MVSGFLDSRWVPGFTIGSWIHDGSFILRKAAQHCTGMTNWPNTIQCLGSDDIMSLGIKYSALLKVEPPSAHGDSSNPNVHSQCSRQMFMANVYGKRFREMVEPITTPPGKVFERRGLLQVKSFREKNSNRVRRY